VPWADDQAINTWVFKKYPKQSTIVTHTAFKLLLNLMVLERKCSGIANLAPVGKHSLSQTNKQQLEFNPRPFG
jgi:hypothetical protein